MSWLLIYKCEIDKPKELNKSKEHTYNWLSKWLGSSFDKQVSNVETFDYGESGNNEASIWHKSVSEIGDFEFDIIVSEGLKLGKVRPHFTRYEQRCFFVFVFKSDIDPKQSKPIVDEWLKTGMSVANKEFNLNACIPTFEVKYKTGIYNESLGVNQPIIVDLNSNGNKNLENNELKINLSVSYDNSIQYKDKYYRHMTIVILGNGKTSISDYSTLAHTFLVYFIRTQNIEEVLRKADDYNEKSQIILNRFKRYWADIRKSYILLSGESLFSRYLSKNQLSPRKIMGKQLVVIGLLEAQMTKVKNDYLEANREFEKSYERLLLTLQRFDNKEIEKSALGLKELLLTDHRQKEKSFNDNYEMMLLYKSGITELRNDHDSGNNMSLQIIMSILSIALIFWSAGTLTYDKYMVINNTLSTTFIRFSGYLLPAALAFVFIVIIVSMRFLAKASNPYDNKLIKLINKRDYKNIELWLYENEFQEKSTDNSYSIKDIVKESDRLICFLLLYFNDYNDIKIKEILNKYLNIA